MTLRSRNLQQEEINKLVYQCDGAVFTTHECLKQKKKREKKKKTLYDAPLIMTITKYSSSDLAKALAEASRSSRENSHGGKT